MVYSTFICTFAVTAVICLHFAVILCTYVPLKLNLVNLGERPLSNCVEFVQTADNIRIICVHILKNIRENGGVPRLACKEYLEYLTVGGPITVNAMIYLLVS